MRIDKMVSSNYTPALNRLRRLSRVYDWFLMCVLAIGIYVLTSRTHSILHKKSMLLELTSLFYLLFYCPVWDAFLGGTIGKSVAHLKIISTKPLKANISLFQSYKRVIYASWPMLLCVIMIIGSNYGFDKEVEMPDDESGENTIVSLFSYIGYFFVLVQIAYLWMVISPQRIKSQTSILGHEIAVDIPNTGQGKHDIFANTAVVTDIQKYQPPIIELDFSS